MSRFSNGSAASRSNCGVRHRVICLLLLFGLPALGGDAYDVIVSVDAAGQSGEASATIRIRASREAVWPLLASCSEELRIVPGLVSCQVMESAPDHSWQRIRHVVDYSWYLPRLTYDVMATYHRPDSIVVERISGDMVRLRGSWTLQAEGGDTLAHYDVDVVPGFWVPNWIIRAAMRRDLPKMLRNLRARAESAHNE
jgi:hypothetical protein